jgi:hypothetical protein
VTLIAFIAPFAHSAIYSTITESQGKPTDATYKYTIVSWDENDVLPNPCFGKTPCAISINHRHELDGTGGKPFTVWRSTTSGGVACVSTSKTTGELARCLRENPSNVKGSSMNGTSGVNLNLPYSNVVKHVGPALTQECVGMFYHLSANLDNSGQLLPGSVCGVAPPPVGACKMPGSIELDHLTLPNNEIDGNKKTSKFVIDCNRIVYSELHIIGMKNGYLPLGDSGVMSTIELNGKNASNMVPLVLMEGQNVLDISSTLSSVGRPKAGAHRGDAVLVWTVP